MTDRLYLSRFRARNFRSFGAVDIALPGKPGLVVLEGPNGLGKTSWMEALEWALSGSVHRWRRQDDEHGINTEQQIRRRNAPHGEECSVAVDFGELNTTWTEGTIPTAATWLCEDPGRWSLSPDNLNGFLRGTHILPQSSSLRLLHLDAKERWKQILRVASGYSEIDDLSDALQRAKRPLTTEVNARRDRRDEARNGLGDWVARVEAIASKRLQAETVGGFLAPSHVRALLEDEEVPEKVPAVEDTELGAQELISWISSQTAACRSEQGELKRRRESLTALADVPGRWEAGNIALVDADATLSTRESQEQQFRAVVEQRVAEEESRSSSAAHAASDESVQRRHLENLVLLATSLSSVRTAQASVADASETAAVLDVAFAQAVEGRDRARQAATLRRTYDADAAAYQRRVTTYETATRAWTRLQELLAQRQTLAAAVERLSAVLVSSQQALESARATLTEREGETARARDLADQVRAAAGAVQGLVAALARHVHDDSDKCPLCLADYPGPGVLRTRIETAKQAQDPAIAQAEGALAEALAREGDAAVGLEQATEAHAQAQRGHTANQEELDALDRESAELRGRMAGIRQGHEDEDLNALRQATEHGELGSAAAAPKEPISILVVRLEEAEEAVRTAQRRREAAHAAVAEAATALAELNARVASLQEATRITPGDDIQARVTAARKEVAATTETVRLSRQALSISQAATEQAREGLATATTATIAARAARDQELAKQQALERLWKEHGLALPPSPARLTSADEDVAERIAVGDKRIALLVDAIEGLGRWLAYAALDTEAKRLDAEAGGTGPAGWEAHTARLRGVVEAAEATYRRAESARLNIERMAEGARSARRSMRDELESRLTPILTPMLRSLIVDQTIATAVIGLNEQRTRTAMSATVGHEETDLLTLASEGQLSGVNLAVQLSMALAFRWSRWPAVLLDDPAQYSDVVHSTNLVETLRVLALHHGFQVFLATHERDFALYVERKFQNDGLAATRVMFREPLDHTKGVVPRIAAG